MTRCSRAVLRLLLFAAITVSLLSGGRAGASSPAPLPPLPSISALQHPPLQVPPHLSLSLLPHPANPPDRRIFARAAARSGVPIALLLAVSYVQSYWGDHGGRPSIDGGYGLMDLTHNTERDTLGAAARLLGVAPTRVAHDDALNVLGGALLLARAARALSPDHRLPRTLGGWALAVVWLTGMRTRLAAEAVLRDVYGLLERGVTWHGRLGGALALAATPDLRGLDAVLPRAQGRSGKQGADYPGAVWAPSPNYTRANRPRGRLGVYYAVIHDTEGSCGSALSWLDNPWSRASAHFLVCQDGTVYQLVHVRDIAWHAGNWYVNQHSIGIEHEGFRDSGGYTQAQYDASAAILAWLDRTYHLGIALDRNVVMGHENVPNGGHTDPGPWWDWPYYMSQLRGGTAYDGGDRRVAMVAVPTLSFYSCPSPTCTLIGTANWGEQFALLGRKGGWARVSFGGASAWADAAALAPGSGTRLQVTIPLLNVRDEPSYHGQIIGVIAKGQVYVSRLLDSTLDKRGWWLIAYNHRYGFVTSQYLRALGPIVPKGTPTPTASLPTPPIPTLPVPTATPGASATALLTAEASATVSATPTGSATALTATPTSSSTPTPTPTGSPPGATTATGTVTATQTFTAPTGTVTATETVTALATLTATETFTASAPVSAPLTLASGLVPTPTLIPFPFPTATATVTPTATLTPTLTPTSTPSPTATVTPTATLAPTPSPTPTPLRLRTLSVSLRRSNVGLGAPLRLRVHTNVGHATLRYRLDLFGGTTLRASGRTDARGNADQAFLLPDRHWLNVELRRLARLKRGFRSLPHSLGARYSVTASWHGRTLTRHGAFRIVLFEAGPQPAANNRQKMHPKKE